MHRFYLIGFGLLMAFDTLAQISFKYAANQAMPLAADLDWLLRVFGQPWIYGAFIGYIGAFFTWMSLLKRAPIGPAFAASHLEVVTVMLASVWLFDERISASQAFGALLIIGGIVCLALGEAQETRSAAEPGRADP
ncbi:EamA family transporter [Pigmentiphaga sp.]|jgi:Membrane transporters of cations and cationic drugs|uniref:DMT family transporter n=1 Tax=Pigmentiphaga sp. TaxID=1977564 RepID=UPI0025CE4ADD|nr:EamA family transporter [Pigmentiphaga sp.]MBX6316852.1 EamA family transporter [Pigmentiphaga sp.]